MVKDITVVETNYNEYALVLKHKVFHREYTQVALYGEADDARVCASDKRAHVCERNETARLLVGRAPRVRVDVVQKFKAFALSRGFPREAILNPPPAGTKWNS